MSAYVTTAGAQLWAGILFGFTAVPTSYFVALCTSEPGKSTDGTLLASLEPDVSSGYERQEVLCPSGWRQSTNTIVLDEAVDFPSPLVNWGVLRYWALCTAAVDGLVLCFSNFLNPLELPAGYPLTLPKSALHIGFDHMQSPVVPL